MNWYGDKLYLDGITDKDKKNEIINDLTLDDEKSSCKVLDIAGKNNVFYYAVEELNKEDGTTSVVGGVVITSIQNHTLKKNIMDEAQGPFYYDCPKRILDILTPTTSQYAMCWRNKCAEYQERKTLISEMRKLSDKEPDTLFFIKNSRTFAYPTGGVFKVIAPDAIACGRMWYDKSTVFRASDTVKVFSLTALEKNFYERLQSIADAKATSPLETKQILSEIAMIVGKSDVDQIRLGNILAAYYNIYSLLDNEIFTPDIIKGILEMNDKLVGVIPSRQLFDLSQEIVSAYNQRQEPNGKTEIPNYREI